MPGGGQKMNRCKFRVQAFAAAAIIVASAAACSTAPKGLALTSAANAQSSTVTVAAIPTADLLGLYIAQDDGLFAEQGLHVTIEKIPSSQAIISEQLAGQVDISAGSYIPYIAAEAQGAKFRILAEASTLRPDTRVLVIPARSRIANITDLIGKKIGVNGTNSIGTLLISALLSEHGLSPAKVDFVTDDSGFPAMPGQLEAGEWSAAFLAEPYVTAAEERYGDRVLADLDQGATTDFPIDGYVATQAWAEKYPRTAAAFDRALEQGQELADTNPVAAEMAMGRSDNLSSQVTAVMALPGFPTGPVDVTRIQREADAMLQFGMLGPAYRTEVEQGTLVKSMIAVGS
jgi:NitT/TauT family transport system substrate-binding protein